MIGPDQVVGYLTVRVHERLHNDRKLGAFLIEPAFCRATFMWADGRIEVKEMFPSDELARAVREADQRLAGDADVEDQYLGGIAGAFDARWGELVVIERNNLSLPHLEPIGAEVRRILTECLKQ